MSLINEALRRARLEAARQEAARRGDPPPVLPAALPDRRRFPWGLFALALVIGFVIAATAVWLVGWNARSHSDAPETVVHSSAASTAKLAEGAATSAAPATAQPSPAETTMPVERPAATPAPKTISPPSSPAPSPEATVAPETQVHPPAVRAAAATRPAPPESARDESHTSFVDGYTYVGSIDVHGRRLVLGGIAWSSIQPTAVLNDAVVGVGDEVAGFRVLAVQPNRVKLSTEGKKFYLRLP